MTSFDLTKMKAACQAARRTLNAVRPLIQPGITTADIDHFVHNDTVKLGGYPAPLNYHGFPKSCCTSVNDVVCHGIPGPYVLKTGDIVNVDVTTVLDGHFGDCSATFCVGPYDQVDPKVAHLVALTEQAMFNGIFAVRPNCSLSDVGRIIQNMADNHGYGIVREFGGHGIGVQFHTPPHVAHHPDSGLDIVMEPGMIFTIEPMLNMGSPDIYIEDDGWTVRTRDGLPSAQFENTVLVTETGAEILTC